MAKIEESGPWTVGCETGPDGHTSFFLQSEDFTHNARLYIDGCFEDDAELDVYAHEIAKRLNEWRG